MSDSDSSEHVVPEGGLPQPLQQPPHSNGFVPEEVDQPQPHNIDNNNGVNGFMAGQHEDGEDGDWGEDEIAELNQILDELQEQEELQEPEHMEEELQDELQEQEELQEPEHMEEELQDELQEPHFGEWTEEEKALLEIALLEEGHDWERIAMFHVTTRSASDIEYFYNFLRQ
ncbi:hypothetical protein TSUD_251990 [Trifolium subterraneum]|uniref:SANT domain-containing protein n=1 Tax=Trifolium subterraneum TaxID=3900 RepID=A0A2Z6M9L7_TRISU|nr:hypothetical protein TSUD_251990 [Trifolium subterraneum]